MNEDDVLEAMRVGRTIEQVLAEPEFVAAVRRVEKGYLAEFADAETDTARLQVWAKTRALQDLITELHTTVQRGTLAQKLRERWEAAKVRARRISRKRS